MIRSLGRLCAFFAYIVVVNTPDSVRAGSVAVGSSTLIGNLDYSDTFTLTANGGEAGRTANTFPVPSSGLNIENTYSNPTQSWGSSLWSISSDSAASNGGLAYPGGSGGGSATGITQAVSATNADVIYGLNYGLHNNYVVQTDIVQTADRVGFTSGTSPNNITSGLAVFFRADSVAGHPYGGVGLFNGTLETAVYNTASGNYTSGASLLLTGTSVGQWNNYAVDFDQADHLLFIYVNQTLLKELDLNVFAGGLYSNYSNAAVSVDTYGSDRTWTDNFQIGAAAAVPEPSTAMLAGMGAIAIAIRAYRSRRKAAATTA